MGDRAGRSVLTSGWFLYTSNQPLIQSHTSERTTDSDTGSQTAAVNNHASPFKRSVVTAVRSTSLGFGEQIDKHRVTQKLLLDVLLPGHRELILKSCSDHHYPFLRRSRQPPLAVTYFFLLFSADSFGITVQ
ncbi:uncharacterized protein H6S33_008519 [Morchella sextelata]|uniref:uncharacterized protein n=1 Tax=Morchella sextelata TaxID=1174677 RepID=UPI001D04307C|nr:uncharacterized protein H6S33_008519 [Morchella sextelata]KAH0602869.1 hypothetical protein H6S33_008519 [Morchella sextelata]